MLTISPIRAFTDNYIWLLQRDARAIAVDPGEAAPLMRALDDAGLRLEAILLTHHHGDHCGGIAELKQRWPDARVYGPAGHPQTDLPQQDGSRFSCLGEAFQTLAVPGHTLDHLAFLTGRELFCGDTLFAAGCGRLFEGSAAQMHASLAKIAQLDDSTRIYPAHEYTLANLRFALAAEPENPTLIFRQRLAQALRDKDRPTLPSTLQLERATNPFLRCGEPTLRAAAERHSGRKLNQETEIFAALREWKDGFR